MTIESVTNAAYTDNTRTAIRCTVLLDNDVELPDFVLTAANQNAFTAELWNRLSAGEFGAIATPPPGKDDIVSVANPVYVRADHSMIDCQVTFGDGRVYPYTATHTDGTEYGVKLWAELNAGEHGPIAPYPA